MYPQAGSIVHGVMRTFGLALAAAFLIGGCHHKSSSNNNGDGGSGTSCAAPGGMCNVDGDCCVGTCDAASKSCVLTAGGGAGGTGAGCLANGAACTSSVQCCGLSCVSGSCAGVCTQDGQACTSDAQCCGGNCAGGTCAPIVAGGCTTDGNACSDGSACCSKNCQGGVCITTAAGCQPIGDVCYSGTDCCSGNCTIPAGKTAGTCAQIQTTGECAMDGEPCPGCSSCCSRVCAATASGASVCQLAGGCRIQGDTCYKDTDCCGAAGSGLPGDGLVKCQMVAGTNPPSGFCTMPSGGGVCDPEGDVCGIQPPQACGTNAREDCCDCMPPKFNCCKLDKAGVPRCFGGSTTQCPDGYNGQPGCCIAAGQQCTFSSECCNGAPCLPDSTGVLKCGSACSQQGGACTSDGDCCAGLPCNVPAGQTMGTCGAPPPPPAGDMGMPACSYVGQSCSTTRPCCGGSACSGPTGAACAAGETDCTCFGIIM